MKLLLVATLSLFLAGCGLCPTKVEIQKVNIPVATVPSVKMPQKPVLEMESSSIQLNGYDNYVKSLESDLVRMNLYASNLENIIKTYNDLSVKLDQANKKEVNNGNQK